MLPDFVIIGAARSATTSLFYYLKQHPDIFLPDEKELNFFSYDPSDQSGLVRPGTGPGDRAATHWTRNFEDYAENFVGRRSGQITGEASPSYLYSPITVDKLAQICPQVKVIAILRHPVDRAWSHYLHMVRNGRESLAFPDALRTEEERTAQGWEFAWHYRNMGYYGEQLARFYERFPKDNIRVYLYEDLAEDSSYVVRELLTFLRLNPDVDLPIEAEHERSGEVKSALLARIANRPGLLRSAIRRVVPREFGHKAMEVVRRVNLKPGKPQMPVETQQELLRNYADDIKRTEETLGRDLSPWLSRGE